MNTEATIERYILDKRLSGSGRTEIDSDESLTSTGILDSMALLKLATFVEKQFGVTVGDGELTLENFETINRIKAFVEMKQ